MKRNKSCLLLIVAFLGVYFIGPVMGKNLSTPPLTGYVVHFDFFENAQEARELVGFAKKAGAKVINLVPPAHVWDRPDALAILDDVIENITSRHLKFVITRIDASYPPDRNGERENYLYKNILNRPGQMPDGKPTVDWFCTTVGVKDYERWMEEETKFYANRYGYLPNLLGFNLGPFSEPFVSQRGGFLQFDKEKKRYEITQYTPETEVLWQAWLEKTYRDVSQLNLAYRTNFTSFESIPLPRNEEDLNFPGADRAYVDFIRTINDWFVAQYENCRKIWHEQGGRIEAPFILQFSGFDEEKFLLGRAAYSAFDRRDWAFRADALGLSIYLNGGYKDFGHGSIERLINRIKDEWNYSKPIFVLEGGVENTLPVFDKKELSYFGTVARALAPKTYIYEFLKASFYSSEDPSNPGHLIGKDWKIHKNTTDFMRDLMRDIRRKR